MDDLLKTALLGTAKLSSAVLPEPDPAAALVAKLDESTVERKLLLAAGASAVYRAAGAKGTPAEVPEPAEPETLPVCSPRAANLLRHIFATAPGLLSEALQRATRAGVRLPPDLLPLALQKTPAELRPKLMKLLGTRGRWLAGFNPEWKWVHTTVSAETEASEGLSAELKTAWEEGSVNQRKDALERVRRFDPAQGRQWLEATWKGDKADHRATLLAALQQRLSADDVPFLEQALADRSSKVRTQAVQLLCRLLDSALAARMRERGEAMLELVSQAGGLRNAVAKLAGKVQGQLRITPPTELPKDWEQDGIAAQPSQGVGKRAWWMSQVIALIPPSHWEARFELSPSELIRAATGDEFGTTLVQAWTQAAIAFQLPPWLESLWDFWSEQTTTDSLREEMMMQLLRGMDTAARESRLMCLVEHAKATDGFNWAQALVLLPQPWSSELGRAYLAGLAAVRQQLLRPGSDRTLAWRWIQSLPLAAVGLPVECLAEALECLRLDEADDQHDAYVRQQLHSLTQVIQTRRDLADALPV